MKREHSAGGLVVKKTNTLWEVLVIKDMNGNWTFPKGLVEVGEDELTAARREIYEEVGLTNIELVSPLAQISYWYVREGDKINKIVSYFLFKSTQEETLTPQTEEGISEVEWIEINKVLKNIGYPKTNKPLLEKSIQILS